MALTTQQKQTLLADIQADSELNQLYIDSVFTAIADYYNQIASPDFWVWRTSVSRSEIYNDTSSSDTNWSWTFYKNQNIGEQNAWVQMFMGDVANFAKPNLRSGIAAIFTAGSAVNATHALAIGRRKSTIAEKLLSTGTGSTASPATMNFEGTISFSDIQNLTN